MDRDVWPAFPAYSKGQLVFSCGIRTITNRAESFLSSPQWKQRCSHLLNQVLLRANINRSFSHHFPFSHEIANFSMKTCRHGNMFDESSRSLVFFKSEGLGSHACRPSAIIKSSGCCERRLPAKGIFICWLCCWWFPPVRQVSRQYTDSLFVYSSCSAGGAVFVWTFRPEMVSFQRRSHINSFPVSM